MKVLHTREHTQHVLARLVLLREQQEFSILKTRLRIKYKKTVPLARSTLTRLK
jgi:hypothetical protein